MEGLGGPEARRPEDRDLVKRCCQEVPHSRRQNRSCTGGLRVHPPHCYIVWRLLPAVHVFSFHDGWCWYVLSIGTAVLHNIIYLDCAKVSKRNQRTNSSAKEEWKKIQNSKNITWKTSKVQENKKNQERAKKKNRVKKNSTKVKEKQRKEPSQEPKKESTQEQKNNSQGEKMATPHLQFTIA